MTRIKGQSASATKAAALLFALTALAACTNTARFGGGEPETVAAPPPAASAAAPEPASPAQPPPADLAGRWKLSAAGGGACVVTFGDSAGAAAGTVAPAGGCPGNFFMSRKWTFERDTLTIHDYKGQALGELSLTGDHFEGKDTNGGAITLARP